MWNINSCLYFNIIKEIIKFIEASKLQTQRLPQWTNHAVQLIVKDVQTHFTKFLMLTLENMYIWK
jgi:hypothetical protein